MALYFRGVNGPQLQTTIVIVKASFTVLMPSTMLAKEIDEDSLKKRPLFLRAMFLKEAFLVLRESEDDETPQRAFFASEETHREPAESVVYFRSGILTSQFIPFTEKA